MGLATARRLQLDRPTDRVVLLEREQVLASHQSGHNSGVIHSGIYYRPGTLKARFAIAGNRSMATYAAERGIPHRITGKLIAATRPDELPGLETLLARGRDHGLEVRMLDAAEARTHEPHLAAIAAVHVASTGVIDFRAVALAMAEDLEVAGGRIDLSVDVASIGRAGDEWVLDTSRGEYRADRVVACAGLRSDLLASASGERPRAEIVPFRGEYWQLTAEAAGLVRGLVYPVPDPDFPFLGVHLTRGVDGTVHAGPNAVLALAREGYRWRDVSAREVWSLARSSGFRRLARRHARQGLEEVRRSVSKSRFVAELQRLIPDIRPEHLVRSPAGVRAQALAPNGELVDDFLISGPTSGDTRVPGAAFHVLNAPSPAATSSLEIGAEIARRVELSSRRDPT